jgi:hypothetical protein
MSTGFLDFSSINITEGGGVPLPNGVFPGTVQAAEIVQSSSGTAQVQIKVEITEPAYAGSVRTEWINLQPSDPSKAAAHLQVWATALLSIGLTIDQIKAAGQIPHEQIPGIFAGRDCTVEISERTKMDGSTTQRLRFLKPATYEVRRAAQDAAGGPQASAPAAAAPALAPTPVPAPTALPTPPAAAVAPAAVPAAVAAAPAPASAGLAALLGR